MSDARCLLLLVSEVGAWLYGTYVHRIWSWQKEGWKSLPTAKSIVLRDFGFRAIADLDFSFACSFDDTHGRGCCVQ
jgi:hypothetical protein